ncbi:MAG: ATP-grasp domain-containing protein [Methylohalobius sp.]|nr:ATP-grasp domain-containing protein [Methylohalobius sp.]
MRILVFEYITGGGLATESLPVELLSTAEAMLEAKLSDLAGRTLKVLRDERLPTLPIKDNQEIEVLSVKPGNFDSVWQKGLQWAEGVWLTAPESGGILAKLSSHVVSAGKKLLGSYPYAVALAGDKLETTRALTRVGIKCVPTWPLFEFANQVPPPWVVKPRDGVGCVGARIVWDLEELATFPKDFLIQPRMAGEPMSISAIFAEGRAELLSVNRQRVKEEGGRFELLGCEVNALPQIGPRWRELCQKIAMAIPGLWGYVGIDLLLAHDEMLVLEINPRLTLSYAGLSQAIGSSVGEWIAQLAEGKISLAEIALRRSRHSGRQVWVDA